MTTPRHLVAFGVLPLLLLGCGNDLTGPAGNAPPQPVEVRAFALASPDAVLLVTGSTHGTLETCDCTGPMPGGLARRSGLVASYRHTFGPSSLLLDTGDVFWLEPADLRNRYVIRGYRMIGYDAVVLGDQEWAACDLPLAEIFREGPSVLSSTVRSAEPPAGFAPLDVLHHQTPTARLAVLSDLRPDALQFFEQARLDELAFDDPEILPRRIAELKRQDTCVVVVVHGSDDDLRKAVRRLDADLFIRGHAEQSPTTLRRVAGKPVLQVGGRQFLGALAMKLSPTGRIQQLDYRREVVSEDWPLDRRMIALFREYLRHRAEQAGLKPAR